LLTREQLRLDLQQVFVARDEEESLVAAFHFPSRGRARQVKFRFRIRESLLKYMLDSAEEGWDVAESLARLAGGYRSLSDDERRFLDQALVDFEQLCVNFMYAALPRLLKSAALLTRLALAQPRSGASPRAISSPDEVNERDDFEEYIVNISSGWPLLRTRFKCFDVLRLPPDHAKRDVDAGYLVPISEVERHPDRFGEPYLEAIAAYRKRREEEARATVARPAPTDSETLLATSEGRKTRDQILAALARIAEDVFPSGPGRPLARTEEETAALASELQDDLHRRLADYIRRRIKKTRRAVYAEMAANGRYGPRNESLSAATIKRLIERQTPRRPKRVRK